MGFLVGEVQLFDFLSLGSQFREVRSLHVEVDGVLGFDDFGGEELGGRGRLGVLGRAMMHLEIRAIYYIESDI